MSRRYDSNEVWLEGRTANEHQKAAALQRALADVAEGHSAQAASRNRGVSVERLRSLVRARGAEVAP